MVGAVGAVLGPLTEGDPRRVGPYTTLGRLGAGALGPLYAGRADDGRVAAVRALRPELLADEEVRAKLAADLAAARTVPGPFAVPVLAADLEAETPWAASALVAGVPLARAVAEHGPLPEPALLALAGGIAEALAAVHAAGVMHGDLRPGTVMLTIDGPRLVDYALARAFDGAVDLGVAGFLAPEQALGRKVTPSADLFALGSTLFYATTGRAPFGEGTAKEVKTKVAKSSPVLGKLPEAMKELIRGCLQKDANGRAQPQQVVEYVQRRAPVPLSSRWLPPEVAADVRAAAAETPGGDGTDTVVGVAAVGVAAGGFDENPDAKATVVAAPVVPVAPVAPVGSAAPGMAHQVDMGVPFGGVGPAGAIAPGGQTADFGAAPLQPTGAPGFAGPPGMPSDQTGPQSIASAPFDTPPTPLQAAPAPAPTPASAPAPGPSRRKLLLALSGGAVAAVGGGAVAMGGLGGSSGTTTAADSNPATFPAGGAPSTAVSTGASAAAPGGAAPTSAAVPSGAGRQHPLPPDGALPPPAGAAGSLQGPAAAPFWELAGVGRVSSMASGEGALVVVGESGVTGYDLGGNGKWGPVPGAGVPGSGNGVVASGVAYLIVASGAGSELLALDIKTGAQKWRTPLSAASDGAGARIGGVLGGAVFVVGLSGTVPFLWAVDAATGTQRWLKNGVQFATLAVPSDGTQVVVAGAPGPDAVGTVAGVDVGNGDQVWARPLKTSVDYSHVSVNMAAFADGVYVSLLVDAQNPGALVGGSVSGGQGKWTAQLPVPAGDGGTLALITASPLTAGAVVAVSRRGLYAVDVPSGRVIWQSQSAESFNTVSDAGAPQIADLIVYVYDRKGSWWAVDLATGKTRWQYTAPHFDGATDPVWVAVSGGVVLWTGGKLVMVAARG